jgi:hypothetical protein
MTTFAGLLASLIGLISYWPYIRGILRRTTCPERSAWLIWAAEYTVLFAAQIAKGTLSSDLLIGAQFVAVGVIYVLSLRYGTGELDTRRLLLFGSVMVVLVIWHLTDNPALAILLALAIEWSAVVLTALKTYRLPGTESRLAWAMAGLAGTIDLWAVGNGSPVLYAYPVSLIVMSVSIVGASQLGARHSGRARARAAASPG